MAIIKLNYFQHHNVVFLAQDLLGKLLFTCIDGVLCGGMITETEAYKSTNDRASHAFNGRRTARNEMMYAGGGVIYVFRCYGVHNMLNIVTHIESVPDAILIRGIIPVLNRESMLKRLHKNTWTTPLTSGPGKVAKALGIELTHNGLSLDSAWIWLEENPQFDPTQYRLHITPRIGIDYAGKDALLPYRFMLTEKKTTFAIH
jgi:DNA-3-methyladenine glycosylase